MADEALTTRAAETGWHHQWQLFHRALAAGEAGAALVEAECEADPELARRVLRLLEAHRRSTGFLDPPGFAERLEIFSEEERRIGPYRLIDELGSGGMGIVFLAEQEEPIRRRVAVKVIKLGLDSFEVVSRFEAERQALAMMNHPNIALALDAGITDGGRPFFAMEFVDGAPITEFCDDHRLPLEERLRLMIDVCQGVHHAHLKGIIHRDLKPSNILVVRRDGMAVPKIIDFGVAKALDGPLTPRHVETAFGRLVGTPEYMSPEQAGSEVDGRSDIYSLGLVLHRLLVGEVPLSSQSLQHREPAELRRLLLEGGPACPSSTFDGLEPDRARDIAQERQLEPKSLQRRLRGDLDAIVARATARDPEERYTSASELAEDLRRHLEGRPTLASPPRPIYALWTYLARHRVAVALTVLLLGLLAYQGEHLRRAQAEAALERETKEQVSEFLNSLIQQAGPAVDEDAPTARQLLDRSLDRIRHHPPPDSDDHAKLLETIARSYESLGLRENASTLRAQAQEIRRRHEGSISSDAEGSPADVAAPSP